VIAPGLVASRFRGFLSCLYCISNKYTVNGETWIDTDIFQIYNSGMNARKKRRGRPPKGSQSVKSETLLLRLEPRERQSFGEAAELAGVPLAVWIRERLRKVAAKELDEANRPIAFLEK
jgi:hypothetical protein